MRIRVFMCITQMLVALLLLPQLSDGKGTLETILAAMKVFAQQTEDNKDCHVFPGAKDCLVDFDAKCPNSAHNNVWEDQFGGHTLDITGQPLVNDPQCPAVRFNRNVRTFPLNLSPSKVPALTIEVLARPHSIPRGSTGWLVSTDNGGWDRSIILSDQRFVGVGVAVGYFRPTPAIGVARMNRWIHLVATFENGKQSTTYRNYYVRDSYVPNNNEGADRFYIGGAVWNNHFVDADIGLVRVYSDRLRDEEVKALYQRVSACVEQGCTLETNKRYYGGGFMNGGNADHVAPYPLGVSSAQACKAACAAHSECRQYIWYSGACYRLRSSYTGVANTAGFVSGTCPW